MLLHNAAQNRSRTNSEIFGSDDLSRSMHKDDVCLKTTDVNTRDKCDSVNDEKAVSPAPDFCSRDNSADNEDEDTMGIFRDAGTDDDSVGSVGYYPFAPRTKKELMVDLRDAGSSTGSRKWEHLDVKTDWKTVNSIAISIIDKFTMRTNGSCISPRVPGVSWSYFGADPEWGEKQAAQLTVELETALVNYDVKIEKNLGRVEVVPRLMHKGKIVTEFLKKITTQRAGKLPSFVLVAGADSSESDIFDAVYKQISDCRPQDGIETCAAFSVHVGSAINCSAGAFVPSEDDVEELLVTLANSDSTVKPANSCNMIIDGSIE